MNKYTLDKFWLGLVAGILLPPITAFIIYQIAFASKFSFSISSEMASHLTSYMVAVFKLGCLSNLLVFLPTFYLKMNNASKGVMASTFLCFLVVLIYALI